MKLFKYLFSSLGFLFFLLVFTILINGCAIHPQAWEPPAKPVFKEELRLNEKLTNISKIDLGVWNGPEEFAFDAEGNVYCGVHKGKTNFKEGAILKISPNGHVEEFLKTNAWVTGMAFDQEEYLIAMIHGKGLVRISPDKQVEELVTKDPSGRPLLMGSGLTIARNGVIYFANLSTENTSSPRTINKLFLELKPTGGVYRYDPKSRKTTVISDGNYFPNGIALSIDESFLLLSETSKYRVLKYWLKGSKAGESEVLLDNLAGFPNNICRRENGNFWVGFTIKRNDQLDALHPKIGLKKLVYGLPSFIQPKVEKFGMVLEISEKGEILQGLYDTSGESIMEAGAVKEFQNSLYIGGDVVSYIAKYEINNVKPSITKEVDIK